MWRSILLYLYNLKYERIVSLYYLTIEKVIYYSLKFVEPGAPHISKQRLYYKLC